MGRLAEGKGARVHEWSHVENGYHATVAACLEKAPLARLKMTALRQRVASTNARLIIQLHECPVLPRS